MAKKIENKQIVRNISSSLFAQIVSLIVGFIMGLVVPKFIDEYQYAYWHIYLLYVSYVGVLHFGLLDGIVLRYSQYDYEELDKNRLRSQFAALLFINSIAWIIVFAYGVFSGGLIKLIAILVAFGIFTKNIFTYNSFLFQITNRIHNYASIVIIQRVVYGFFVVLLIVFEQRNFIWFCIADLAGDCAGIFFGLFYNKDLHFGKLLPLKEVLQETWWNISSGILLMFSTWSSMLLVGGAKMIIEWKWGPLVFGQTSFAFAIASLMLSFVSAISIVLFPSLKRMRQEDLPLFYKKLREMMVPFLFWSLLLYYPECWILETWLPQYTNSLVYLGLLSPMVVYASVVSLLTNNYLKAYRKENELLLINITAVFLAACLYGLSAYWFKDFTVMLLAVVLVIMLRSIVSEFFVIKLIHIELKKEFIIEFVLTFAFLVSVQFYNKIAGFCFYLTLLFIYSYFYYTNIKEIGNRFYLLLHRNR